MSKTYRDPFVLESRQKKAGPLQDRRRILKNKPLKEEDIPTEKPFYESDETDDAIYDEYRYPDEDLYPDDITYDSD